MTKKDFEPAGDEPDKGATDDEDEQEGIIGRSEARASGVNNGGFGSQIEYLLKHNAAAAVERIIRDAAGDPEVELLVVIDRREPATEQERAVAVSGVVGREVDSMDMIGRGLDLLFRFDTAQAAAQAAQKLAGEGLPSIQSVTVHDPRRW
jgi:hypothetical protein